MNSYTKETISDLLFSKIDSIIVVNARDNSYQTIKKSGIFECFLEDQGSYKKLIEKLWFHFNDKINKITEDYHVFIPMIGKFNGKYVDRIKLCIEEKVHLIQISIYPLDENGDEYLFYYG